MWRNSLFSRSNWLMFSRNSFIYYQNSCCLIFCQRSQRLVSSFALYLWTTKWNQITAKQFSCFCQVWQCILNVTLRRFRAHSVAAQPSTEVEAKAYAWREQKTQCTGGWEMKGNTKCKCLSKVSDHLTEPELLWWFWACIHTSEV